MLIWTTLALLLMSSLVLVSSETKSRFTNVKCEVLQPTCCAYKVCRLKVLGRGVIGLNIHAMILMGRVDNVLINLSVWRKYNAFQPFLFNVTGDFCKYMKRARSKKITFESMFLDAVLKNSNINHTCPYEHEIYVYNMVFQEKFLQLLPVPSGEYQYQVLIGVNNTWQTKIYVTVLRQEDLIKD